MSDFVRSSLRRLVGHGFTPTVRDATPIARLVAWHYRLGLELDPEMVFDPRNVDEFVRAEVSSRAASTYRARLRRVGPLLTSRAPWERRSPSFPRRTLVDPYSDGELEAVLRDCHSQSTEARRRAALAVYTLGLGAGLDGRWITRIRGIDITTAGAALVVDVPSPSPRQVAVVRSLQVATTELAELAGPELLVGPGPHDRNWLNHLTGRLQPSAGTPRLSPPRLRATWLLRHLTWGTRLPELCRAAGLAGPAPLGDLLPLVSRFDAAAELEELRGR